MSPLPPSASKVRPSGWKVALAAWPLVLLAAGLTWLRFLPNEKGWLGPDYSAWLPYLLAGSDWIVRNGPFSVAWFSPAQCGGIPLHADPQGAALSLPQWLSLVLPPFAMLRASFIAYATAGYFGAFWLARLGFGASHTASLVAGALFAANSFLGARFAIGHLSFAPFMLLPLAALCVLDHRAGRLATQPGHAPSAWAGWIYRCGVFGIIVAITLESGMLVLLPVFLWSVLAMLALLILVLGGGATRPLLRLLAGTAWGAVLAASKIAAVLALLHNFPRDAYTLPGFLSLGESALMVLRALFLGPFPDMTARLANAAVRMDRHEFEYAVGLAPPVFGAAAVLAWRRGGTALGTRRRLALDVLIILLLAPVALNTNGAGWTNALKAIPILRNSSSLLRWVAADMLPAVMVAALALDFLASPGGAVPASGKQHFFSHSPGRRRASLAAAALVLSLPVLVWPGRAYYGPEGGGRYDPSAMQFGWRSLHGKGPAPIAQIGVRDPSRESVDWWFLQRQDRMTDGVSPLECYDPLFGYGLEAFPRGALHAGSVFAHNGAALNLKNPACYVFPGANDCRPGDAFPASAIDQAARFVAYKDFSWRKPEFFRVAEWLGLIAWPVTGVFLMGAFVARRRLA